MKLSDFVQLYVSRSQQSLRDFAGPLGWCSLANMFLRRMESDGVPNLIPEKTVPLPIVQRHYLVPPPDFRRIVRCFIPEYYSGDVIPLFASNTGNRILLNLDAPWGSNGDGKCPVTVTVVPSPSTEQFGVGAICLPWPNPALDQYYGWMVQFPTGILAGRSVVISGSSTVSGGNVTLTVEPPLPSNIDTAGMTIYLYQYYALLQYVPTFTPLSSPDDEIPISDRYELLLASFLRWQSKQDEEQRSLFKAEFEDEYARLGLENNTPTEDDLRAVQRSCPGLEDLAGL